jgi:protein-S-isoprenylcysteine O-methyltransferase Ste14
MAYYRENHSLINDPVAGARRVTNLLVLSSYLLGGISLLGFGVFLALGSFELVPLGLTTSAALLLDAGLCLVFFVQHSGMIRRGFRGRLARVLPDHYHAAVYAVASGVALLVLLVGWQRVEVVVWSLDDRWRWLSRGLFLVAGVVFWWAVAALGSFDAFGVRSARRGARLRAAATPSLRIAGPYRLVRHPIYTSLLICLWAVPTVTLDRLLLAVLTTAWLVVGARLEERDLVADFGEPYRRYQRAVPMLLPWRGIAG